jgi:uncharacterized damage-inducible protein DinB
MAGAEKIWLERWQQQQDIVFLAAGFDGTKEDLIVIWEAASQHILDFIAGMNEADLSSSFHFVRANNEQHVSRYDESMLHTLNHATYHRGQIVTMLRQVGFVAVSSTDMLTFYRERRVDLQS